VRSRESECERVSDRVCARERLCVRESARARESGSASVPVSISRSLWRREMRTRRVASRSAACDLLNAAHCATACTGLLNWVCVCVCVCVCVYIIYIHIYIFTLYRSPECCPLRHGLHRIVPFVYGDIYLQRIDLFVYGDIYIYISFIGIRTLCARVTRGWIDQI
jgi:hypothetical protein